MPAWIDSQFVTLILKEETAKIGTIPSMFITGSFTVKANWELSQGLYLQKGLKLMLLNNFSRYWILMLFEFCCDFAKPLGIGNIR